MPFVGVAGARVPGSIARLVAAGQVPVTFSDELSDGAGTPVAITTSIATRQVYQRGKSNIVLAGTYDVSGGEPSGMAWRVGSGDWYQFTVETIGSNSWSGTLAIPASYLAQGTLEVKPVNGQNVTPAQVLNITVTDIFVINGQSNADGDGTNNQAYTKVTYDWTVKKGSSAWAVLTSDPWSNSGGSFAPALAENFDAAGIPPAFIAGQTVDGSGFDNNNWNPGDTIHDNAVSIMDTALAASGGCKAELWIQGESDANAGSGDAGFTQSEYYNAFVAKQDNFDSLITYFSGTPVFISQLGEKTATTTLDRIRLAIQQLWDDDSRCYPGPNLITEDYGDDLHYGKVQGSITTELAEAQLDRIGAMWYRCLAAEFYSGSASGRGASILSATLGSGAQDDEVTVVFDRAMQNHTDVQGWEVFDAYGAVKLTGAAATTNVADDTVVLTAHRSLSGATKLSFGKGMGGSGGTLKDTASTPMPPDFVFESSLGTATGSAPTVNNIFTLAADGTATGLTALTSTITTGVADGDGGNDAVSWKDTNPGTNGACGIRCGNIAFNNGMNHISMRVKTIASDATRMWLRFVPANMTNTPRISFDITNDALADSERVNYSVNGGGLKPWMNAKCTALGSGWFRIEGWVDLAGADFTGLLQIYMGDTWDDQSVNRNNSNEVAMHDFICEYTT